MQQQQMGGYNGMGGANNIMDSLKSNMMTMMMINNMNGSNNSKNGGNGKQDMFYMIYAFLMTNVIDMIFKNVPFLFNIIQRKYMNKIDTIKAELNNKIMDTTDNKVKKKTASITVTINVNNQDNIFGQAILDYITNNKNTTHVSYIRNNFILNQKDVINIDEDIFAKMSISSGVDSGSAQGSQGSSQNDSTSQITQVIEIYSFKLTNDQLRDYLDNIKQKYMINIKNKLGNKRYYFNMFPINAMVDIDKRKDYSRLPPNMLFTMKQFQTNRKFSNLFGNDIDTIRNRVSFFTKNKSWYDEKGIPYTLGLLLSGNPGTGKTSTIKCLANETNRHICNINLNNDISKRQLENLFFNEDIYVTNPNTNQTETYNIPLNQRVYVLEDVDCQDDIVKERSLTKNSDSHSDNQDKNKIDLSFLLNLLDGVLENPGRIVIMTSNHPDVLDSALIRPGRIDVIAKFSNCTNETVSKMIEFFYDMKLTNDELDIINNLLPEMLTPAELSKVMFENFGDYEKAIKKLQEISDRKKKKIEEAKLKELEVIRETQRIKELEEIREAQRLKDIEKMSIITDASNAVIEVSAEHDDISDDTTEETSGETEDAQNIKSGEKSKTVDYPLVFIKNKFQEPIKLDNGNTVSAKILNEKMEEYANTILKANLSCHKKSWDKIDDYVKNDKFDKITKSQINKYKDLRKDYIDLNQDIIFETPFFKEFTKYMHNAELSGLIKEDFKTNVGEILVTEFFKDSLSHELPYEYNDELRSIYNKNKLDISNKGKTTINRVEHRICMCLDLYNTLTRLSYIEKNDFSNLKDSTSDLLGGNSIQFSSYS